MFVNLTPHDIVIQTDRQRIVVQPSGKIARVESITMDWGEVDGVPVVYTTYKDVEGIPTPENGVIYLVSSLVAGMVKRKDVLAPDTGPTAIRLNGQVIAVRRLQTF